jgi:KDO2-lipid IV(A) lauroyltransferase
MPDASGAKMAGKRRNRLWQWIEYGAIRLFALFVLMFPIELNLKTGRLLGWIWYMAFPRHRARAREHIVASLGPSLSEDDIRRLTLRSMQQMTMGLMEMLCTPRLVNEWTWPRYIRLVGLADGVRLLLGRGGMVMLTGHYGNWELLGFTLAALGFDIVAVMRPLDNPLLNEWLVRTRERRGLRLLYKKGAIESAEDVVRRGGALCFIADQDAGRKGLFVEFFGRPASTYKSIGLLAMGCEVPIVVGYARRVGPGFSYEIGVNRIIRPQDWADRDDPLRWVTREYNAAIEAFVREAPEQYLWVHRRWKSQPRKGRRTAEAAAPAERRRPARRAR